MQKYFPVGVPGDECSNDVCDCTDTSGTAWEILQGRVYALESDALTGSNLTASLAPVSAPAGNGFGVHLVNVSESQTTGGLSTAEVEQYFTDKLGDMSKFDSFMDFNAMFYTTGLAAYKSTFEADGINMYTTYWTYDSKTWTSIFIHVPKTQLVLELCQDTKLDGVVNYHPTPRASPRAIEHALSLVQPLENSATTGAIISPLAVNRAADESTMAKLEEFYVTGMGASMAVNSTGGGADPDFKAYKCFLWPGATVDVCFYSRAASATKGDFKVADFEKMLNTVHENIIVKYPFCGRDKWTDNHYAIDSFQADTAKIVSYIDEKSVPVYCESTPFGTSAHYAIDPTGWGIQMDLQFSTTPKACSSSKNSAARNLLQHSNPACSPGTCS